MIGFAEEVQTPGLSDTDCFCNKVNTPGSGHWHWRPGRVLLGHFFSSDMRIMCDITSTIQTLSWFHFSSFTSSNVPLALSVSFHC